MNAESIRKIKNNTAQENPKNKKHNFDIATKNKNILMKKTESSQKQKITQDSVAQEHNIQKDAHPR